MNCRLGKITDYLSKDIKATFKQKCKIFDRLTSMKKYNFLIKHFEIIFGLIACRISWNIKDIKCICFKYLNENEFLLVQYGLIGNRFVLDNQLVQYPFIRKTGIIELYWNHLIGIRQSGLSIHDNNCYIHDFYFKCNSKYIGNIYIGLIGTDKKLSKLISDARKDKDELIFNERNHSLSYYINIYCNESPYSPMGSSIYVLQYGYPEEVLRNRNSKWPVKLNQDDTIHFKINCCTKLILLFYNDKLVHSLNLADIDIDFKNILFYPTISLPIVEKEIIEFEMRTDIIDYDYC